MKSQSNVITGERLRRQAEARGSPTSVGGFCSEKSRCHRIMREGIIEFKERFVWHAEEMKRGDGAGENTVR